MIVYQMRVSYVSWNYSTHSSDDSLDTTPICKRSMYSPYTKPLTELKQLSHGYLGKLSDNVSPYTCRTYTSKSKSKSPSGKKRIGNGNNNRDFEWAWQSRKLKSDEILLSRFYSNKEDRR